MCVNSPDVIFANHEEPKAGGSSRALSRALSARGLKSRRAAMETIDAVVKGGGVHALLVPALRRRRSLVASLPEGHPSRASHVDAVTRLYT